jgi:hypothetical protein
LNIHDQILKRYRDFAVTMSLSIQALNNDTSFLLTFAPSVSSPRSDEITVLIDPWIVGPAVTITGNRAIAILKRPSDASISSLKQLDPQPDLICISQNAPDHCHPDTLKTLKHDTACRILAHSSAAAVIRSWKHFSDPDTVVPVKYFNASDPSSSGFKFSPSLGGSDNGSSASNNSSSSPSKEEDVMETIKVDLIAEPWDMAAMHTILAISYMPPASEAPITVVYCPHGAVPATLSPYLATLSSTTRKVLFHSCNQSKGPWFFGSPTYVYGAKEGVEVAKAMAAEAWIRAHDEDKSPTGVGTVGTWGIDVDVDAVRRLLDDTGVDSCAFVALGAGERWNLGSNHATKA